MMTTLSVFVALVPATMGSTQELVSASTDMIVFVSDRGGDETIWSMRSDGSELRQLTTRPPNGMGDQTPHLARGCGEITFTSYRFGGWKIATMSGNGSGLRCFDARLSGVGSSRFWT